jgi:hypothetical protein
MSALGGPRTARRRASLRRTRAKLALAAALCLVASFVFGPFGFAQAAPPGSLTITTLGCSPQIGVDVRASLLATGSKSNVVHFNWSSGSFSSSFDYDVSPGSYAGLQATDTLHVDWLTEETSTDPLPYDATGTVTLSWQWDNGNTKDVATTTVTRTCT